MKQHLNQWIIVAVAVAVAVLLVGCGKAPSGPASPGPIVEPLDSGASRVTLTESHVKRLGIQYEEMRNNQGNLESSHDVLVYDNFGKEWVYSSPQPTVFERIAVEVERIEGDTVYFSQGPSSGAMLVTSGAAELLGIECGVGEKSTTLGSLCQGAQ